EDGRAILARSAEERKRTGEIFDGEARFLGETVRRQIIGVAPRRDLPDLKQALFDAAFEVGVDEAERDAEVGGKLTLRLSTMSLHGFQGAEHDPGIVRFVGARRLRHPNPPIRATSTAFTA